MAAHYNETTQDAEQDIMDTIEKMPPGTDRLEAMSELSRYEYRFDASVLRGWLEQIRPDIWENMP